ncbi:hypothetical protein BGX27_005524 [Mortierella sp. AM989]|nr:hypothetical protein BGX27_005524 [Mortierella sp. AM989]
MLSDAPESILPPISHALELPEIVFKIAPHLDIADIIACSSVSKAFHILFSPFVWQDLHFGEPCELDPDQPFARKISFTSGCRNTGLQDTDDAGVTQQQLKEIYQRNAPFIRSLSIHSHDSIYPLDPGRGASRIQSLTMEGLSLENKNHTVEHWDRCKRLFSQSQSSLQSVSLINWGYDIEKKRECGQPIWNPILRCAEALNLRSLSLNNCCIRGRHMKSFWIVCERLEKLEICGVYLDIFMPVAHKMKPRGKKAENNHVSANAVSSDSMDPIPHTYPSRFPQLKELRLEVSWPSSPKQLNLIIAQCPLLQTLCWRTTRWGVYVRKKFCELFISSTWPCLDSITITGYGTFILDDDRARILKSAKLPLRRLDFSTEITQPETLILFRRHFSTIQTIDLTFCRGNSTSAWTIEVLTSCPYLETITAKAITAQEIFDAEPWVCLNLRIFSVFIDMAFPNNGHNRKFTTEEIKQCRKVYEQLAVLKQLRELNTLGAINTLVYIDNSPQQHLIPLPLRLKAGLNLMSTSSKLEDIRFWGGNQEVHMKELKWMVQHWKRLKRIKGNWCIGHSANQNNYLHYGKLADWLGERGIFTEGSHCYTFVRGSVDGVDYQDCCGATEDED